MDFTFIDLFCGTGGFRIPFDELGGTCVFSSEIDKYARQSYSINFLEQPSGDIQQIEEDAIPPHDVLLAGFPCQPFSGAGNKLGFIDTRGTLFFEIERIVRHHKPKVIFLENVKGLIGHDKGKTLTVIINSLADMGYIVRWSLLNSVDFGVPQSRERIYIVAARKHFVFPASSSKENVESIIDQHVDGRCTLSDKSWTGIRHRKRSNDYETAVLSVLQEDVDNKYRLGDKTWDCLQRLKVENKIKKNGFSYSLVSPESPYTRTITARYGKDGSEALLYQENANPRKFTPREIARLQGFPEWYKIVVSDTQAYRQFGNAVTVPVIREIAREIVRQGLLDA